MRRLVLGLVLAVLSVSSFAQEELNLQKEQKQIARVQRKAEQARIKEEMVTLTKQMLESHKFVLEADYVGDGKGNRIPVNSTLNFVAIDSSKGVLQIGTPFGYGWNGVGGVTVEGDITKYELKEIKGKRSNSYSLMIVLMGSSGIFDVHFNISETGLADAIVSSTTRGQLKYTGNFVPLELSRVFKGTTTY
jgi:hypothetical protein